MEVRTIRIGIVTGSRVDTNRDGTQPGRILQAIITDPKDVQNIQTCQAGDEFNPPRGCGVVLAAGGDAYKIEVAIDDGIAPVMDPGGKRIYATDPDGEAEVAEVRLHPDGKVEVFNGEASVTLDASGAITIHGTNLHIDCPVTMDQTLAVTGAVTSQLSVTAPNVTGTTDVTFAGKSAATHTHGGVEAGTDESGEPV